MAGNGIIGDADVGQSKYLNQAARDKIYNKALARVQKRLPGLAANATATNVVVKTNTIFREGNKLYPEAVYKDKVTGEIVMDLTINKNTSVAWVESMIVHGLTHVGQRLNGTGVNEYDAYKAQYQYESKYHNSVLPVYGPYLDSSGNFKPKSAFNNAHRARTGQNPNSTVKVKPYIVR